MEISNKKPSIITATVLHEGFPVLPEAIVRDEIFPKLELESLCSLSCVCWSLHSLASEAISTLLTLDISAFSPEGEILRQIAPRLRGVKTVAIDALQMDSRSVSSVLGPDIEELKLLKWCSLMLYGVLAVIGERCPSLRILAVELASDGLPDNFKGSLVKMLKRVLCLEHLSIKIRGAENGTFDLASLNLLPETIKFLKLQPINEDVAYQFIEKLKDKRKVLSNSVKKSITPHLGFSGSTLQRLSLVLDVISDRLIISIKSSLPLLVELELEDGPCNEPRLPNDLTNNGLVFLGSCKLLTSLSIVRSRINGPVSFKRINDLALFILSESCGALESVKLGGFSVVTDSGFSSFLRSCRSLKKFEIRNATLLSDLAFHNIFGGVCPLVELKLLSCKLITSEAVTILSSSTTLELLDTNGCRSIADPSLNYISCLQALKSLNLGGADITDSGLDVLSKGDLLLVNLCLRGCTRVTDRGIISFFNDGKRIRKTLTSLDISHMPGVSDRAILAIVLSAEAITELSMRYCFYVTNLSIQTLAYGRSSGMCRVQKLDICNCKLLSTEILELFEKPLFQGLRWLGVGITRLLEKRDELYKIVGMRPWLNICTYCCELGCHDCWHLHWN